MSRGSKTYYVSGLTDVTTQLTLDTEINAAINETPQWGDVAIEKDVNGLLDPATPGDHRRANLTFQFNGVSWINILQRSADDPSTDTKTAFNQEQMVGNVTPIRAAHVEEIRSFLSFIQKTYAKRYGDAWFNEHDWTRAVMSWSAGSGNSTGKIFMGSYGVASDQKHLTLEFGQTDNAIMKFIHRAASGSYSTVLELKKDLVSLCADVEIQGKLTVQGDTRLNEDAYVNKKLSAAYLVNRNQFFYLNPTNNLDETTDAPTDGRALGRGTGDVLRVNYEGDFVGGTLIQGGLNHTPDIASSPASSYRVWTEEYAGHNDTNPDQLGIDADKLEGFHGSENDIPNTIPVRTNGPGNIIKGLVERAQQCNMLGAPIYYDYYYVSSFSLVWDTKVTIDCTAMAQQFMSDYGTANGVPIGDFRVMAIPHLSYQFFQESGWGVKSFKAQFLDWTAGPYKPRIIYGGKKSSGYGSVGGAIEVVLIGAWQEHLKYFPF